MSDLPPGWAPASLGDLVTRGRTDATLIKGKLAQEPFPGAVPAYSASGQDVWCSEAGNRGPGIVLSAVGARCGKAFFANEEWTAIANTHALIPNHGMSPRFLWYLLNDENFWVKGGTAQPFVKLPASLKLPVRLPPSAEQARIVAAIETLFSRLDAGAAATHQAALHVKHLRSAALRELLDIMDAPLVEVRCMATAIQYGYTAKAQKSCDGPKMLRITDIQNRVVNWDTVPHCVIGDEEAKRFRLTSGDLVFARTGATVGKSFLVRDVPDAVFASYLIRLRFRSDVLPEYVALYFQSQDYWRQVSRGSRGIGQPNVNAAILGKITMPLPDGQRQKRVVCAMAELDAELDRLVTTLAEETRRVGVLRSAILAAAFAGDLVAQDPNDEPATTLLARIADEAASRKRSDRPTARRRKAPA